MASARISVHFRSEMRQRTQGFERGVGLYNTFGEWTYISPHTRVPPGLSHLGMGPLMIPVFG